ncbi:hypothetical protein CAPTEDRAFT_189389 [Capitella teleta]|uniref:Uncharacterized protein n=1 Tax=Capitella teleta TaxID=283909 RepID=R7TVB8_CAPTE|nr:hypothetical protein CAPTEDRAFT_189389 [Capitella teleta]|eukprot:ELT97669.1 hypothetical protein CAPTEDRAFT_189389 [Capitella teleta]
MAKVTLALVHDFIKKQTETFIAEITSLRDEVAALKAQLAATNLTGSPQSTPAQPSSFADVVKTSIRSALEEDKAKQEVIIQRLPENNRDVADVHEICAKAEVIVKPTAVTRLGKSHPNRPRIVKVTFPSTFDARTFRSKVEESKILAISETWLTDAISNHEVLPDSFNIYRKDRCTTQPSKRGGGILLAIDTHIE